MSRRSFSRASTSSTRSPGPISSFNGVPILETAPYYAVFWAGWVPIVVAVRARLLASWELLVGGEVTGEQDVQASGSVGVGLVAKAGEEEELGTFLAGAEPLARGEAFTLSWFAMRTAPNVFWIVDTFADDGGRGQHLAGDIARALLAKAPDLLAEPPSIEKADVLAAKEG